MNCPKCNKDLVIGIEWESSGSLFQNGLELLEKTKHRILAIHIICTNYNFRKTIKPSPEEYKGGFSK